MPDYSKGKVYKLVSNQTDKIYIGSTVQPLYKRCFQHKCTYTRYLNGKYHYVTSFEIVKYDDCEIILIEECPCENVEQLRARERHFIELLDCVNKRIPGRNKKEYYEDNKEKVLERRKKYYEDNKEKLLECHKKYYEDNKEKIADQNAGYYQANKEKIAEKFTCECGVTIRKDSKSKHERSIKHQTFLASPPPPLYTE